MEVVQVLHMNGGKGETSYANNSLVQVKLITKTLPRIFSNHIGTYIQVVHDIPTNGLFRSGQCHVKKDIFYVPYIVT